MGKDNSHLIKLQKVFLRERVSRQGCEGFSSPAFAGSRSEAQPGAARPDASGAAQINQALPPTPPFHRPNKSPVLGDAILISPF